MGSLNPENNIKGELDDSGYVQDDNPSKEAPAQITEELHGSTMNILDLCDDILLSILKHCTPRDLKAVGFTCTRLAAVALDRTLWQRVDTRCEPSGKYRMRWLLTNALGVHTTSLKVCGYAREARGCLGFMSSPEDNPSKSSAEETAEGAAAAGTSKQSDEEPVLFQPSDQPAPRDEDWCPLWASDRDAGRPSPVPTGLGCPGPQPTLSRPAIAQLTSLCTGLTELALEYCVIDCHLVYGTCSQTTIGMFPASLKKLSLRGTKCFNLEKSFLYRIQDTLVYLEDLDVSLCDWVEPACMLPLSKMPRLVKLIMQQCLKLSEFVAYASLATRYGFKTLKVLDLRGSPVGDSEVSALGWVPQLEELYLAPPAAAAPVADHAHLARDPPPPHAELEPWEQQEPEYYSNKYLGEQWIRDEDTSSVDRSFQHAVGGEACVILQKAQMQIADPLGDILNRDGLAAPPAPPRPARPAAPSNQRVRDGIIEIRRMEAALDPLRLRLGARFRRLPNDNAGRQGLIPGPLDPIPGPLDPIIDPDLANFRAHEARRRRLQRRQNVGIRPQGGYIISDTEYSRRNFHMYHGSIDQQVNEGANRRNGGASGSESDEKGAASGGENDKKGVENAEKGVESGGENDEKGGENAENDAESDNESGNNKSDSDDSDDSGDEDPKPSTRLAMTNEARNQPDSASEPGPSSRVTNEPFTTKAARKYYEDTTCLVSRRILKESWNNYRKRTGPVNSDRPRVDTDEDDSSSDDDKPLVKRARVSDMANNQGDSQPSTSNGISTGPSRSSTKSSGSGKKSSGSAKVSSSSAKKSSGLVKKSSNTSNTPSGSSISPSDSAQPGPSSSGQNSSNDDCTSSQSTYSQSEQNASMPRLTISEFDARFGFGSIHPEIQAGLNAASSSSNDCACLHGPDRLDRCKFMLSDIPMLAPSANLDRAGPQQQQPRASTSRQNVLSDEQPSSSSRGEQSDPATDKPSSTTTEQKVPTNDAQAASSSRDNGAGGNRPGMQRFVRFRHNAEPVVYDGFRAHNNNDAEQPNWNRGPGRVARQMPLLTNILDEPIAGFAIPGAAGADGNASNNDMPRHRILYVNVGRRRHAMYQVSMPEAAGPMDLRTQLNRTANMNLIYSSHVAPRMEHTSLVTDAAIRRFGRADNDNVNYVNIGPFGPVPAPYEDPYARPNRSSLRVLSATGYRHITNASLNHLMTAAPLLRSLDFTGTRVTRPGVERFRNARPECRVTYGPLDAPVVDDDL